MPPSKSSEEPTPLRDFTVVQLEDFNGLNKDNKNKVYISLRRDVFDVTSARDTFYGPGQPYFSFAGREASRAMAKMSFDESELRDGLNVSELGPFESSTLDDWIQKFHMKGYPIVGRSALTSNYLLCLLTFICGVLFFSLYPCLILYCIYFTIKNKGSLNLRKMESLLESNC